MIPKPTSEQAKLQILYMLDHISTELETDQIWCAFSDMELLPYVDFMEYLNELASGSMIAKKQSGSSFFYSITQKGRNILSEFKIDIRRSVRERIDEYCKTHKKELLAARDYVTEIEHIGGDEYTAKLKMLHNHNAVFEMNILYKSREEALTAAKKWQKNAAKIYSDIFDSLAD